MSLATPGGQPAADALATPHSAAAASLSSIALPFDNALHRYIHGAMSREEAERILMAEKPRKDGRFLVRVRATEGACRVRVQPDNTVGLLFHNQTRPTTKRSSSAEVEASFASTAHLRRGSNVSLCSISSTSTIASGLYGDVEYNGSRRGSVIEHNFEFGPKDSLTRAARLAAENVFKGEEATRSRRNTLSAAQPGVEAHALVDAAGPDAPHQYVLSVIFKGRPTHHLLKRASHGAPFVVNKMPTKAMTLPDVIAGLAYPSGPWPVVLLEPVAPIEDAVELQYESHLVCAKGNFKLALHALDKALESLQRAMTLFPAKAAQLEHDTALTYEMRSMVRYNQGEYDCAMADARLALQYEPEWWKPHMNIGMILTVLERIEEAVAAYERAARLIPPGHLKENQCEQTIAHLRARLEQDRQQESLAASEAVEQQRRRSKETEDNTSSRVSGAFFSEDLPDEAVWYCLARQGAATVAACAHATLALTGKTPDNVEGGLKPYRPKTLDVQRRQLEALAKSHALPTGRLRKSQAQRVQGWKQWFMLRMGQSLAEGTPQPSHVVTSGLYSWALTTLHVLERGMPADQLLTGSKTVHLVTNTPVEGFTALELCALCPGVSEWTVIEIVPGKSQAIHLVCDGMLPGDDVAPAQRLRHVICYGQYSELTERHPELMAKPDIVLFANTTKHVGSETEACAEDALHDLHRNGACVALTQERACDYDSVRSWLARQMLTAAPSEHGGANDFASLGPAVTWEDPYEMAEDASSPPPSPLAAPNRKELVVSSLESSSSSEVSSGSSTSSNSSATGLDVSESTAVNTRASGRRKRQSYLPMLPRRLAAGVAKVQALGKSGTGTSWQNKTDYVDISSDLTPEARRKLCVTAAAIAAEPGKTLVRERAEGCSNGYLILLA